ncbi:lipopolysaccharide assembly protein LapB [Bradyrhizobium sp. NC92]|uniref:tetratricopeptide repeat protein n=1 Tax=Bradyrhizobium sp. (strain NC92) TaxID=55395 RepID=UPI0021A9AA98|nr:tetratricopeptide repeat protein [Bradyrhizobium sp. NC92]UWU66728.1 tetratricopeptide repeat protein [Bradyrhizobium sp. NC92]
MFGMVGRTLICAAAGFGVLALTALLEISGARAEMPLTSKCNAAGNFSIDDRIAGCTAIIQAAGTGMQQGVVMARFRRAMFYRQKGEIDLAIADYNEIIERDPGNLNARLARASIYVQRRDHEAALADYDKVIELDRNNTYAYLGRARLNLKDDVDRAIIDYDRALRIHPDNVHALIGRSFAYETRGESDRALADCARAIVIGPDHWIGQFCRADIYLARGQTDLSLSDFDRAVQLNPKDPRPYVGRARVFQVQGDLGKALSDLDLAIEINPNNPSFHRLRGAVHFQSGHLTEALADLRRSNELDRKDAYTQLWFDLAQRKSGSGSELGEAAKLIDPSRWPAPIVRFFLGEITFEALLKFAQDDSTRKTREQVCEANFYAGELALQRGADQAVRLMRAAADECPKRFVEWAAANAELHKLETKP